jgi:3-hydroxyethyl bacteriochlorophyllide a dehydrogenase
MIAPSATAEALRQTGNTPRQALAVVLSEPGSIALDRLQLNEPGEEDVVVDIEWSGISTGTERLLWSGRMPHFPGLGYPLVPGYESVGRVREAGARSGIAVGERVFVPGSRCFGEIRGLFGGAASRLVVAGSRVVPVQPSLQETAVLMALAATAQHALRATADGSVDLIIGHGVLGRLIARVAMASGAPAPVVWETLAQRRDAADGYPVLDPADDPRRDYRSIIDVSGDAALLDTLIGRLAPGGTVVLAGFYAEPIRFAFAPAFQREIRLQVAAEWRPDDLIVVKSLAETGCLSLDDLITHRCPAEQASDAYRTAFSDPGCLKMILDWRGRQ